MLHHNNARHRPPRPLITVHGILLGSLDKTLLGFLKIDDVPDGIEILKNDVESVAVGGDGGKTYISLDVLVLCRLMGQQGEKRRRSSVQGLHTTAV